MSDSSLVPERQLVFSPTLASTIGLEKVMNPFLLERDIDSFLKLKRDWATFKAESGLM